MVGPDNRLLTPAWVSAGDVHKAVEITSEDVIEQPIADLSRPRHAVPGSGHLAAGMPIEQLGGGLDPSTLRRLALDEPEIEPGKIRCTVLDFNCFGNVQLNVREAQLVEAGLDEAPALAVGAVSGAADARRGRTYADFEPGEYGAICDPRGRLTIVRGNPANALEGLALALGDPVWISRPGSGGAQ